MRKIIECTVKYDCIRKNMNENIKNCESIKRQSAAVASTIATRTPKKKKKKRQERKKKTNYAKIIRNEKFGVDGVDITIEWQRKETKSIKFARKWKTIFNMNDIIE